MSIEIREIRRSDAKDYIEVLNYYIRETYNAFPEDERGLDWFDKLYAEFHDYPNLCIYDKDKDKLGGYAYIKPYKDAPCYRHVVEVTYFIAPEYTGQGFGSKMLANIIERAKDMGLKVIMAQISSLNEGSLNFHAKHGFEKCGHFKNILQKHDKVFDIIWMQLEI